MSPPHFTLHLRALLTLPYRLCNPPPAVGIVRSCKVTPIIKVSLDDVLNKRHLPPLTLKDFEEWLVFVDGSPNYLYFLLWLKEYETRYEAWLTQSGYANPPSLPSLDESYVNLIPPSPSLALFFTRAKRTFFDPQAPYALPSDALAPLVAAHAPSTHSLSPSIPHFSVKPSSLPPALAAHPHPHPRTLDPLANAAHRALKDRLADFAAAACNNVGPRRAWCGVAGGTAITLILGLLPTLAGLFYARARAWRLLGLPGAWLGTTIVIASFHGICMMIYVFGDLRQLRAFELARPPISPPRAVARARPRLRSFFTQTPDVSDADTDTSLPGTPAEKATVESPMTDTFTSEEKPVWSATSTGTPVVRLAPAPAPSEASTMTGESSVSEGAIDISPAYYPDGVEPPAGTLRSVMSGLGSVRSSVGRVLTWVLRGAGAVSHTGTFTVPDASSHTHTGTFGVPRAQGSLSPTERKSDCDLEKGIQTDTDTDRDSTDMEPDAADRAESDAQRFTAQFIPFAYPVSAAAADADLEKKQCGPAHDVPMFDFAGLPPPCLNIPPPPPVAPQVHKLDEVPPPRRDTCPRHPAVEALAAGPAFTARATFGPVTRVLSPVVQRGQWEVVVRSAGVAAVGVGAFFGAVIALPGVK